jgi:hypothetical protein
MSKGKIHPKGIVSQATGPTFTENDAAKFDNHGKTKGKTMANGIVSEGKGPTITCNETHIPTMNADKPAPMSKVKKTGKGTDVFGAAKPSEHDFPGAPYELKTHYAK